MLNCRFSSRFLLSLITLLSLAVFFGPLPPARAQVVDFEGAVQSWRLQYIHFQALKSGKWDDFEQACLADPNLTKRAFLALVYHAYEHDDLSPEEAQETVALALKLAQKFEELYGEDEFLDLVKVTVTGDQASFDASFDACRTRIEDWSAAPRYTEDSPLGEQRYGEYPYTVLDVGISLEDYNLYEKPFLIKLGRLDLARIFGVFDLIVQESDTAIPVYKAYVDLLAHYELDPSEDLSRSAEQDALVLDGMKVNVLLSLGLFESGQKKASEILSALGDGDSIFTLSLLLSCSNAALRVGRLTEARSYLERARLSSDAGYCPPPLEYALRTADYRLRRVEGYSPDVAQADRDMRQAWSAFDNYCPLTRIDDDASWDLARLATRFWIDEMADFESSVSGEYLYRRLSEMRNDWLANAPSMPNVDSDALLFSEHLTRPIEVYLAIFDQLSYLLESPIRPSLTDIGLMTQLVDLKNGVDFAASAPKLYGLDQVSPNFPPFDLKQSGLYPEISGRVSLMQARDTRRSTEDRIELLKQSMAQFQKAGIPEVTIDYLLKAGGLAHQLGQSDLALSYWKQALEIADRLDYVFWSAKASLALAQEYERRKDWASAGLYSERASQRLEQGVGLVGQDQKQARQLKQANQQMAELSVKAAVATDQPEKALAAVVRGKEVYLAGDAVRGQKEAQPAVASLQREKQQVAKMSEQVERLQALPASATRDELLQSGQQLLAQSKSDFLLKSRELRQKYPLLYGQVLKFDPLDLPDVQKTLPDEAAVIQYFPTEETLYIFVVTKDAFRLRSVAIGDKELNQGVTAFVRGVRRNSAGDQGLEAQGAELASWLLSPCADDIAAKSLLVFIPTGALNLLPFACLPEANGMPLVVDKQVIELAKPTDFYRIAGSDPVRVSSLVAFANATGDLPAAGAEGQEISALFPGSQLFLGSQANKANFLKYGDKAQILHLATHGESNSEDSLANYLSLSGKDSIAQEEILGLDLSQTSIVTLSACNTAIGERLDTKFVSSLAEAFWLGGSRSVVASLWAVNDESTALLMTEFYKQLRQGQGRAKSLRAAQLLVRSQENSAHPYYWAGFVLFGDWR